MIQPEMKVWLGPALRAAGMGGLLLCVAFLGAQSEREESYGPTMEIGAPPIRAPSEDPLAPDAGHPIHATAPTPTPASPSPCTKDAASPVSRGILKDGRIVMNDASKEDFTKLPGVGDSRAEAIVQLRERMGKFKSVNDLLRVRGIGWKTLQTLKEMIVVDRPQEDVAPKEDAASPEKSPEPTEKQPSAARSVPAPTGPSPS